MGVKPCGSCGLCSTSRVWLSTAPSSLSMNTDLHPAAALPASMSELHPMAQKKGSRLASLCSGARAVRPMQQQAEEHCMPYSPKHEMA